MRIYDIIEKKRDNKKLSYEEIAFFVNGAVSKRIPDYQITALLMAIFIRGMDREETVNLTLAMAKSGDSEDLKKGVCDKHSTGGVGDKTTLIVMPLVAAAGKKMAKMAGRGLGFTGGTIDKLESITGFNTNPDSSRYWKIFNTVGAAISSQTGNFSPADKIFYSLRDVTATVNSLPLIASSIMSKKIALGAENLVLDVKCGSGAFMKTEDEARKLAETMVNIGRDAGRNTKAIISNMNEPLGLAVGNSLEVIEAAEVLKGRGEEKLTEICLTLTSLLTGDSKEKLIELIKSGKAFEKFKEIVEAQGGDTRLLSDYSLFKKPKFKKEVSFDNNGFVCNINAEEIGKAAGILGAGRNVVGENIDYSAGILLNKKVGNSISKGETFCTLYSDFEEKIADSEKLIQNAVEISDQKPQDQKIIYDIIMNR